MNSLKKWKSKGDYLNVYIQQQSHVNKRTYDIKLNKLNALLIATFKKKRFFYQRNFSISTDQHIIILMLFDATKPHSYTRRIASACTLLCAY